MDSGEIYHIFDAFVKPPGKIHWDIMKEWKDLYEGMKDMSKGKVHRDIMKDLKDSSTPLNKHCTCPPGYHKASC